MLHRGDFRDGHVADRRFKPRLYFVYALALMQLFNDFFQQLLTPVQFRSAKLPIIDQFTHGPVPPYRV
ncbi:hypothetical protein D3C73_1599210 [compost metagenome]